MSDLRTLCGNSSTGRNGNNVILRCIPDKALSFLLGIYSVICGDSFILVTWKFAIVLTSLKSSKDSFYFLHTHSLSVYDKNIAEDSQRPLRLDV